MALAALAAVAAFEDEIGQRRGIFPGRRKIYGATGDSRCYISRPTDRAGRASNADLMLTSTISSVETRTSWVVAGVVLVVMAIACGAPGIAVVALKNIAAEVNGERSVPAAASALMWIGSG